MLNIKGITPFIAILSITQLLYSQNRSFPVHMAYEDCIRPSHISQSALDSTISAYYSSWKDDYVVPASSTSGGYYIQSGGGTGGSDGLITISEAHGYGMIIFALMAGDNFLADNSAKEYFDGMYYFYNDHRSSICDELMSWEVLSDGAGGESDTAASAATDGDMDIAYALILAHYQWGSDGTIDYLSEAKRIITKGIKEFETNQDNKRLMLGDWVYYYDEWSWSWILLDDFAWATRSSDWMVGHLKAYEDITGDAYWGSVRDEIYNMVADFVPNHSSKTGLLCDFIDTWNTEPAGEFYLDEFKETNQYYQNACRTPLRFVADWAHNGRAEVKPFLNKSLTWLKDETSEQPENIVFGYNIETGAPLYPDSVSMAFTAPLIAACIVDSSHQQYLNDGWDFMVEQKLSYYPDCLNLLSMLMISGNWWAPLERIEIDNGLENSITKSNFNKSRNFSLKRIKNNLQISIQKTGMILDELSLITLSGRNIELPIKVLDSGRWSADLSGIAKGNYVVKIVAGEKLLHGNIMLVD